MQFSQDIEECLANPMLIRKLDKKRRIEVVEFMHIFRRMWHELRCGIYKESRDWLRRRDGNNKNTNNTPTG